MRIFLDTAETSLIEEYFQTGLIDGVTTNPTLIKKSGKEPEDVYQKIKDIGLLDISMEIVAEETLDMVVIGVGTGGTITGIAKKLKSKNPKIQIVGADPYGSILGGGDEVYPYKVEGIGYDFFPDVLDNSLVDKYIKVDDQNSFTMARRLIKEEGILSGGSSGTVIWAAMEAAKDLGPNQKCLCVLADGIRNYMGKFVLDEWMDKNGFKT